MPPSANRLVMPRGNRLISTPAKRTYKKQVELFKHRHIKSIRPILEALRAYSEEDSILTLDVSCLFYFERHRVYTKAGNYKRIDTNNRLKAALDTVSDMIEVDDLRFASSFIDKRISKTGKDYLDVELKIREVVA